MARKKYKIKQINNIILLTFKNQFEMCQTFFRLQEFYESPSTKLRGKYFTYEEAIEHYAYLDLDEKPMGEFTYFQDWHGFNVPGNIVDKFEDKFFHDLTNKERDLLVKIRTYKNYNDKYYVIACLKGEEETLRHEVGHAMFYLNKEYKKEMLELVNNLPEKLRESIEKELLNIGYSKQVLKDEIHAYCATGLREGMVSWFHRIIYRKHINNFKKVFEKYYGEL